MMDVYKKLFANIGSRNEFIKVAILLIFVMFILSPLFGRKVTLFIGIAALVFFVLGVAAWFKRTFPGDGGR